MLPEVWNGQKAEMAAAEKEGLIEPTSGSGPWIQLHVITFKCIFIFIAHNFNFLLGSLFAGAGKRETFFCFMLSVIFCFSV